MDFEIPQPQTKAEERYIIKRKIKAFCNSFVFYLCRIFPVDRQLISVCTFEGKGGFGCNPKYIVEELHGNHPEYKFVWFVNKDVYKEKEFPKYIKKVPNALWSRAYWLSKSKVWIDNYRKPLGTVKRKGQFYINTWHATIGFKSIGLWRGDQLSPMAYLVSKNDSDMIDRVVIDSDWCRETYPNGMIYDGEYIMAGAPRSDAMFWDRKLLKKKLTDRFALDSDVKFVMYAPTFRENSINGVRSVSQSEGSIDFDILIKILEKRFEGNWYICLRVHPQLAASMKEQDNVVFGKILDLSQDDDISELLPVMDAVITDYSSLAMDASFGDIPVFLYADDIEKYEKDRGGLLWNITTSLNVEVDNNKAMTPGIDVILPYSISKNNDELERNIMKFDEKQYLQKMERFKSEVKLVFDGKASQRVAELIRKQVEK